MKAILAGVVTALIIVAVAQAQAPVTGKWQGTTRNGMQVVLALKATNEALTGTVTRDGQASTITEGKVAKSTITFNAVLGDQAEMLTGELVGEHLKFG